MAAPSLRKAPPTSSRSPVPQHSTAWSSARIQLSAALRLLPLRSTRRRGPAGALSVTEEDVGLPTVVFAPRTTPLNVAGPVTWRMSAGLCAATVPPLMVPDDTCQLIVSPMVTVEPVLLSVPAIL